MFRCFRFQNIQHNSPQFTSSRARGEFVCQLGFWISLDCAVVLVVAFHPEFLQNVSGVKSGHPYVAHGLADERSSLPVRYSVDQGVRGECGSFTCVNPKFMNCITCPKSHQAHVRHSLLYTTSPSTQVYLHIEIKCNIGLYYSNM